MACRDSVKCDYHQLKAVHLFNVVIHQKIRLHQGCKEHDEPVTTKCGVSNLVA